VHLDGGASDLVGGVDPRRRAAHVGLDEGQVVFGAVGPDAAVHPGCRKPCGGADASRNLLILHRLFLLISCGLYSSPAVSGRPSRMFMHWTAAPEDPLPRLSNREISSIWLPSGLAVQ